MKETRPRLHLDRQHDGDAYGTPGILTLQNGLTPLFTCFTAERPWLENRANQSSIPAGDYVVKLRKVGRYADLVAKRWQHEGSLEITAVPDRSGVLIHWGNSPLTDCRGCVLVGEVQGVGSQVKPNTDQEEEILVNKVWRSKPAYQALYAAVITEIKAQGGIGLTIKDFALAPGMTIDDDEGESDLRGDARANTEL